MIIVSSQKKWTGLLARFLRLRLKYWFRAWKVARTFEKQASSHEPGWPGWPGCWDKFRLGFIREISVRFLRGEMAKDPGHVLWCQIRETKQTWWNTKIITFAPIIASATLKAVSLQLNGMLKMWENTAGNSRRCHPDCQNSSCFHPGNRAEVFIWQNFQPAYRDPSRKKPRSRELSQPALSYEHTENFTKDLEVKQDFGNRAHMKRP